MVTAYPISASLMGRHINTYIQDNATYAAMNVPDRIRIGGRDPDFEVEHLKF